MRSRLRAENDLFGGVYAELLEIDKLVFLQFFVKFLGFQVSSPPISPEFSSMFFKPSPNCSHLFANLDPLNFSQFVPVGHFQSAQPATLVDQRIQFQFRIKDTHIYAVHTHVRQLQLTRTHLTVTIARNSPCMAYVFSWPPRRLCVHSVELAVCSFQCYARCAQ